MCTYERCRFVFGPKEERVDVLSDEPEGSMERPYVFFIYKNKASRCAYADALGRPTSSDMAFFFKKRNVNEGKGIQIE